MSRIAGDRDGARAAPLIPMVREAAERRRGRLMEPGLTGWVLFNGFILALLALDLGVFHRRAHEVFVREAALWSAAWVTLALSFNGLLLLWAGPQPALDFLTGYVVEKSLAVDNLFVFVMIFTYFSVPAKYQHRVLFWGILGALVMRGFFIAGGAYVLHRWHWVMYVFGAMLLVTGLKMLFRREVVADPGRNPLVRLIRRLVPMRSEYDGAKFVVREGGRWVATPLFLVLVLVEISDLVFAVDSIPAIFAITQDPFIVYTSNVFAILGLRSMYFLLAGVVHRFVHLKYALSAVLVFIGGKMVLLDVVKVPTAVSLGVIAGLLTLGIVTSLRATRRPQAVPVAAPAGPVAGGLLSHTP
jgi:tellurite resistance protein TerC